MRLFSHKNRAMHLGPFPLERLARRDSGFEYPSSMGHRTLETDTPDNPVSMANAFRDYIDLFDRMRLGDPAPKQAPIPSDPQERANHLKAACYNLDVSMAVTCAIPEQALLAEPIINESLAQAQEKEYLAGSAANVVAETSVKEGRKAWQRSLEDAAKEFKHGYALVLLVEYTREPDPDVDSEAWLVGTQVQRAAVRAAEAAAVMVNYIRFLGFEARLHTPTASDFDLDYLLLCSGLGEISGNNGSSNVSNPYLGDQFGMAVISTTMELAADKPLTERGPMASLKSHGPGWWLGLGGARPGYKGRLYKNRPFHLGPHPMEKLKPQETTTTLIDKPNVPRIPKRHDMFLRAALGDLGEKPQKELENFRMITKSPYGHAMVPPLGAMVPLQYGKEADRIMEGTDDPKKNAEAVKAALYYLGADMVGICELPDYAWYSHDLDGSEIKPYHKYGIAILDDIVGNGLINPVKKWWWDLDSDEQGNIIPARRTNKRQFSTRTNMDPEKQTMGCYPADIASPPVAEKPVILHRKIAVQRYKSAESPDEYKARKMI